MANQISLSALVDAVANEALKKDVEKYKRAGKEATKQIREDIVNEWFMGFNSDSVNEATQYNVYTRATGEFEIQVSVHSYVDIDAYADKPSAARWVSSYGGNTDPKEYVLMLQMNKPGIIGLPKKAKARPESNWSNSKYHENGEGLRTTIFTSKEWRRFQSLVDSMV